MNSDQLTSKIEEAFSELPKPEKEDIAYDKSGNHLECNQVAEFFEGKSWKEINTALLWDEYIGDGSACLSFMNPKAFKYYLPAYMTIAINEYDQADVVADSAIFALLPNKEGDLEGWWSERIRTLDSKQTSCVILFIDYMLKNHKDDYLDNSLDEANKFWVEKWNNDIRERIRRIEEKAMRKLKKQKDQEIDDE